MSPRLVGIAGGTASGKSTVAAGVAAALGEDCLLLVHDRYYHSAPTARGAPVRTNFDHPKALDTARLVADLERLRAGEPASIPDYDFATHTRLPEEEQVLPRRVIVVEGILVLADLALAASFDHRIFVEAPSDVRLARRIRRDVEERGRSAASVLDQYEATVRPMHQRHVAPSRSRADVVLDGMQPPEQLIRVVLELIARSG